MDLKKDYIFILMIVTCFTALPCDGLSYKTVHTWTVLVRDYLVNRFTTRSGGRRPLLYLKFTTPSEREKLSGGLREPSPITHQLGKGDLEQNLGS